MRDSFRDSPKVSEGYFYTVALQAVKGFHLGACGMQPDAVFLVFMCIGKAPGKTISRLEVQDLNLA